MNRLITYAQANLGRGSCLIACEDDQVVLISLGDRDEERKVLLDDEFTRYDNKHDNNSKTDMAQMPKFVEDNGKGPAQDYIKEIDAYLKGRIKDLSHIPVRFPSYASPRRKKVWQLMLDIPYGETATYGYLAKRSGNKKAAIAVGQDCAKNPVALLIPCHRVRSSSSTPSSPKLDYYWGAKWQKYLLDLETQIVS